MATTTSRTASKKTPRRRQGTKKVTSPGILEVFSAAFNAVLDAKDVPALNFGRHTWVSDRYHVSSSAARKWLSGNCMPSWDNMLMIADNLDVTVDELLGRKPTYGGGRTIPIPIRSDAEDPASIFGRVEFEEGVLETAMRMRQNGVELFVVSTDAMAPDISIGDIAFIDTEVQRMEDNKIYMFAAANNRILIRRVILNLDKDNTVRLMSTNPNIQEVKLKAKEIQIGNKTVPSATLRLKGEISWLIKKVTGTSSYGTVAPV